MPHLEPTYLRYIFDGLVKGSIHPENAAELPDGLIGMYEEAFDERISVVKRQKILQRFAIWALLKKEVSAAFVAQVLGESEVDNQEFISTYSAWFNSPESGKYQLYHERLKVYLLQKLSEQEIHTLHEKLISRLEQAIEEQKADEFEWYGLEFIGEHFYSFNEPKLFEISINKEFQERQVLILGDFRSNFRNLDLSLLAGKGNEDRVAILKISAEKLRIRFRLHENLNLIYNSISNNNYPLTAILLDHFVGKIKGLVTLLFFYEFFEGLFKSHPSKPLFIKILMDQLSSIEDDPIKRGWLLPVPESAKETYLNELKKLKQDDFHFRKLTQFILEDNENWDFDFNSFDDETEDFNFDNQDEDEHLKEDFHFEDDLQDTELNDSPIFKSDSINNPFETMSEEEKAELNEFLKSINKEDFDPNLFKREKDNQRKIIPFNERKNQLVEELKVSNDRSKDIKSFALELLKNNNSLVTNISEISFQLLLPIKNSIPRPEFIMLYDQIVSELKSGKSQSNPIAYSHEVKACAEILLENHLFHEAVEWIEMNSQVDMRDDLYANALNSSYIYDKKIYVKVLKSACRFKKTDTSIHINKGSLIREYILTNNWQELEHVLFTSDSFFRTLICGSLLEDDQLFDKISVDEKSLKNWILAFEKTVGSELKSYAIIFGILYNWKFNKNDITENDKSLVNQQIINTVGKEGMKKILSCLKLFSGNEDLILLITGQLKAIIDRNDVLISEIIQEKDDEILLFKSIISCWKNLSTKSKESLKYIFEKIYASTKNSELAERTACAFIINKEIALIDYVFHENSLNKDIPLLLLRNGFVLEAIEALRLCNETLNAIQQFEFWLEVLERSDQEEDAILKLENLITHEFDDLSRSISIEHQSFNYIPLVARLLNKLHKLESFDLFKMVYDKMLNHIECLTVSQNEKRKILFVLTYTFDVNIFKTQMYSVKESQKQLLAGSLSYFKKYHDKIQDKIYEELCIIGQDIELVESALIHLVKCDLFYTNAFESLNETEDLFDFEYWLSLKSPN